MTNLTPKQLHTFLRYDCETGALYWRVRPTSTFATLRAASIWNAQFPGKVAGFAHSAGYRCLDIQGATFYAHRVIWAMETGAWPADVIDHINGDRSDNRIENLREATQEQNTHNSRMKSTNTSGYKGVSTVAKRAKWDAHITVNKKSKYLGSFDTPEEAHNAYCKAANEIRGEFARTSS